MPMLRTPATLAEALEEIERLNFQLALAKGPGTTAKGFLRPRHRMVGAWTSMWTRCTNPNSADWCNYGARGVRVCDRWRDFGTFLADVGERPHGMTLDRIDSSGNYEPGNVRWATVYEQNDNRRTAKLNIEKAEQIRRRYADGEEQKTLAAEFGVSKQLVCNIVAGRYWVRAGRESA